jgi:hypothetical protein
MLEDPITMDLIFFTEFFSKLSPSTSIPAPKVAEEISRSEFQKLAFD